METVVSADLAKSIAHQTPYILTCMYTTYLVIKDGASVGGKQSPPLFAVCRPSLYVLP